MSALSPQEAPDVLEDPTGIHVIAVNRGPAGWQLRRFRTLDGAMRRFGQYARLNVHPPDVLLLEIKSVGELPKQQKEGR